MDTLKKEIFWETLGPYYVYGYKNAQGDWVYIGKGKLKRGQSHVQDKDLDIDDLEIIVKNIGSSAEAHILETYLIMTHKPELNEKSGHHEERFIETKVVDLAEAWEADQVTVHDIYARVIEECADMKRLSTFETTNSVVTFKSGGIQNMEYKLLVDKSFKSIIRIDMKGDNEEDKIDRAKNVTAELQKVHPDFEVENQGKIILLYTNALEDGVAVYSTQVKKLKGIR